MNDVFLLGIAIALLAITGALLIIATAITVNGDAPQPHPSTCQTEPE